MLKKTLFCKETHNINIKDIELLQLLFFQLAHTCSKPNNKDNMFATSFSWVFVVDFEQVFSHQFLHCLKTFKFCFRQTLQPGQTPRNGLQTMNTQSGEQSWLLPSLQELSCLFRFLSSKNGLQTGELLLPKSFAVAMQITCQILQSGGQRLQLLEVTTII